MEKNPAYAEIRSKYTAAKITRKLCKENNLRFRHGFYSSREAGFVQTAVDEFLKNHELTVNDLEKHLVSEEPFPIHDLVQYVTQKVPFRTFKSVDTFITWFYNPLTKRACEDGDEKKLLELVEKKGYQWKEIGMELDQIRARCRTKFLKLKGLYKGNLLVSELKAALKGGVPKTDSEWVELSKKLGHSRKVVEKFVRRYMKMPIIYCEKDMSEMILLAYILKHNFYCSIEIDIDKVTGFLEKCDELYFCQSKDESTAQSREEFFESSFDGLVAVPAAVDLTVDISIDDIFWSNITSEYQIFSATAKSKFYILRSTHGIYTFQDVYETLKMLTKEYFLSQVDKRVFEKTGVNIKNDELDEE